MKIRHPALIKALGFGLAWLVRLWIATLRYRYRPCGPNMDPNQPGFKGRFIYAFWHENILVPAYQYGRRDIHVLISRHADGQLIAEVVRHLGFRVVSGSTTRGGVEALRQMIDLPGGADRTADRSIRNRPRSSLENAKLGSFRSTPALEQSCVCHRSTDSGS